MIRVGDLVTYDKKDHILDYGERYEVMGIDENTFGIMSKWGFVSWHPKYKFKKVTEARSKVINDILR